VAIKSFYILTEEELKELLKKQRILCIGKKVVLNSPEPILPKQLTEWEIINKIFNKK